MWVSLKFRKTFRLEKFCYVQNVYQQKFNDGGVDKTSRTGLRAEI